MSAPRLIKPVCPPEASPSTNQGSLDQNIYLVSLTKPNWLLLPTHSGQMSQDVDDSQPNPTQKTPKPTNSITLTESDT